MSFAENQSILEFVIRNCMHIIFTAAHQTIDVMIVLHEFNLSPISNDRFTLKSFSSGLNVLILFLLHEKIVIDASKRECFADAILLPIHICWHE